MAALSILCSFHCLCTSKTQWAYNKMSNIIQGIKNFIALQTKWSIDLFFPMFIVYALPLNSSWSLLPWAIGSEKTYLWLCLLLMALHWFRSIKVRMNMWTFLQNRKQLLLNSTVTEFHPARHIMESGQRLSVLFPDKVIKTPTVLKSIQRGSHFSDTETKERFRSSLHMSSQSS